MRETNADDSVPLLLQDCRCFLSLLDTIVREVFIPAKFAIILQSCHRQYSVVHQARTFYATSTSKPGKFTGGIGLLIGLEASPWVSIRVRVNPTPHLFPRISILQGYAFLRRPLARPHH